MNLITDFFKIPSVMLFLGFVIGRMSYSLGLEISNPVMIPVYIGLFAFMWWEIKQLSKAEKED